MKMVELRDSFRNEKIKRDTYLSLIHEKQMALEECSELIRTSGVSKIEILKDGVIVTSNEDVKLFVDFEELPAGIALRLLNLGGYETEEFNMAKLLIDEEDTVFDIGANVGFFSLSILKNKQNVKVHAFEPVGHTFENMNRNLAINEFPTNLSEGRVQNYNFGFYNENTTIEFFVPKLCGAASIKQILDHGEATERVQCKLVKMDDFFAEYPFEKLDFIKCDVEGAEKFVYEGAIKSIEKYKPIIFSEMLRKHAKKFNYHPNEIIEMLKGIGYRCFSLGEENTLKELFVMEEQTISTNFFFLHGIKHQEKIERFVK